MDDYTELLEWVGPTGHVSPTYGPLVPGKRYPVPKDQVRGFLKDGDCWTRVAAPKAKAAEGKDKG